LLLQFGIDQIHQDGVRRTLRAGKHPNPDDGRLGLRRDQPDAVFARNERARSADLPQQRAALDSVRPHGGIDFRDGRLQTQNEESSRADNKKRGNEPKGVPSQLALAKVRS
jgi:hypothetical protein